MSFEQEIEGYSISPQQLAVWRASVNKIQSTNISLLLTGAVSPERVAKALREIAQRHEILRSTFPVGEEIGIPLQVVSDDPVVDFEYFETPATDDLPLTDNAGVNARLVRLDETHSRLFLSISALIADAGSARALAKELASTLSESSRDEDAVPQYAQYVEYLQMCRDSADFDEAKQWWQDHDARSIPAPAIAFLKPTDKSLQIDSISLSIPSEISEELKRLSRDEKLSLEALLVCCWVVVLTRISGRRDGAISIETPGRTLADVADMPGVFSRVLPVTFSIKETESFAELWRRMAELVDGIHQNEDGAPEVDEHTPLRFAWLDASETFSTESLAIEVEDVFSSSLPFKLRFACMNSATALRARLDFNTQTDRSDVLPLARYLEHVLEQVAGNIRERVDRIELLDDEARHQLTRGWNQTRRALKDNRPFPIVFRERAEQHANRIALKQGNMQLTFADLQRAVDAYANKLQRRGIGPESVVAVTAEPCVEAVIGILAVLQTGAAFLPVDSLHAKERVEKILRQAGVTTMLCRPCEAEDFPEGAWTTLAIDFEAGETRSPITIPTIFSGNAAYVIYTSGSTGEPKGVVISHHSLSNYLDWCVREYAKTGTGCALHSSLSFDLSITSLLVPLLLGETVHLPGAAQRADHLPSLLNESENYRWLKLTPSHARVAADQVSTKAALGCTQTLILGGESLSSHDLADWTSVSPGAEVINEYGPTEATVGCAVYRAPAATLQDGPVPIGRPIANTAIYLLDENLQPSPIAATGEIYISGDGVARGYLGRPDLTAERFLPNPHTDEAGARMYRTGDLGRCRADGGIEYLGRIDDQVKIQGHRVELGEIEHALVQHPSIREVVVLAKTEQGAAERLIAYFTRPEDASENVALSELREFLSTKLPPYMIPHVYLPLESLPLNANGKIDRAALMRLGLSAAVGPGEYAGPRTLEEEVLATVWANVLGLDRVSIDADYFLLGGDSIRAIQIAGIAAESGLHINLDMIFRHKTIRELAAAIAGPTAPTRISTSPFSLVSEENRLRMPADAEDGYGLSRLQAGMVFERQIHPGSAIYHDIFSFHVKLPLDRTALEKAVAELVSRHPMLRTSFQLEGFSEPLQIVHRSVAPPITFEDLKGFSRQEQRDFVTRWMEEEKRVGFDYSKPPLLRFRAHETSPDSFYYSLSFHHAILDGWSDASMLIELALSYYRLLSGKPIGIDAPSSLYRDFIATERAASHSAEHRRYWLNLLQGCSPLTIPRWGRPGDDGRRGVRMHRVQIGKERSQALINLARELAIPLKSVLLAAHLRVMGFVSGRTDVVTTISSAGRLESADGHRVIGLHLNSTPLRLSLNGGRWLELARAAFAAERDALPWRRYPLADIQRDVGFRRLSETSFYYTHYHLVENLSELPSFEILDQLGYEETSFALVANFSLNPHTSEISLDLAYDTTELPLEQVRSIGGHYDRALESMASDAFANYAYVPLLSEAERAQNLDHAFGVTYETPQGTIITMLEECVRRSPGQQAVVCGDAALSYEQFNRRVSQFARYLQRFGAGPDARIALVLDRSVEMMVAIFAVLKAGAAYVPIEPHQPAERINAILEDARPAAIVTTQAHVSRVSAQSPPIIALETYEPAILEESDSNLDDITSPDNLAYLIYTSGSTGRPKGALINRGNLLHSTNARLKWYKHPAGRFLLLSPYSFDSSIAGIFWTLCSGGTLVLTQGEVHKDPVAIADLMETKKITTTLTVPALYANVLESCAGRDLPEWKTVIVAGQACPMELVRNHYRLFPSVMLYDEYGPTEATVWSTAEHCAASDDVVLIGKSIPNAGNYILDHALMPVSVGTPGELFIGGEGVVRGYLNLPELTAERFLPDPFSTERGARMYRTGDRALYRHDGRIEYLGRVDWQLKIRGHRIEPEELEAVLRSVEGVRDAAVAASSIAGAEARLVGYVVPDEINPPPVQFIRSALERLLPSYMVPSLFVFLDALPVNVNGKLDRKQLPEPTEAKRGGAEYVAPRNNIENALADIWSAVLQVPRVGIEDDFFALGGDSILSIQIIARAKQANINFAPVQLFQARTIKALSEACLTQTSGVARSEANQLLARDLEADAVLDADIYPESAWSKDKFAPNQILLTGGTGFLGAFLLDALLKQTEANVLCLVRCDDARDGAEKIKRTLESFNIWRPVYASRIEAVQGDLTMPLFGLSADQFHSLAANVEAIYHNGAAVNFIQPYATLKSANVEGTREALRLACRVKAKPFHYVSTLSVFASVADRQLITEDDAPPLPIDTDSSAANGYAQSKWVAERLVMMARSRGLPVNIYRPGRIAGDSRTGVSNLSDFTSRFIKGCIQLGAMPDWNGAVNLVTVDYVSEALARLLLQPDSLGKVFHFWHHEPGRWQDLIDWLNSYGYAIKRLPYAEWRKGLENSLDNVLYPLLPTLPEAGFENEQTIPEVNFEMGTEFDCRNTFEHLNDTSLIPTPIDAQLIDRYLAYFVASGFLDAPLK